ECIISPGYQRSGRKQGQAVRIAGGYTNHSDGIARDVDLATLVAAPGEDTATFHDSQIVSGTRGRREIASYVGRQAGLTIAIVTPSRQRATAPERQRVKIASRNGDHIIQLWGYFSFATRVIPPREH